jgi:hypothetical protein
MLFIISFSNCDAGERIGVGDYNNSAVLTRDAGYIFLILFLFFIVCFLLLFMVIYELFLAVLRLHIFFIQILCKVFSIWL